MWEMMHKISYCHQYDDDEEAHLVPLDPIHVACQANLKGLRRATDCKFAQYSLDICLNVNAMNTLLLDPIPTTVMHTNEKWLHHIMDLEQMKVVERCTQSDISFFGKYFSVLKDPTCSRSIFNGKRLSTLCEPPHPVNLMPIQMLLRMAADLGRVNLVIGDIRHWFHQLPFANHRFFGIECGGKFFRWCALPMGWSWSPFIAQCIAWSIILYADEEEEKICDFDHNSSAPPQYVHLRSNGRPCGFMTLLYDNIAVFTNDPRCAEKLHKRIKKNCDRFSVTLKHLDLYMSRCLLVRSPSYQGPVHLGIQYGSAVREKVVQLLWRHDPRKLEKWTFLPAKTTTPSVVARGIGIILWDATVRCAPLCNYGAIIDILIEIAKNTAPTKMDWHSRPIDVTITQRGMHQHGTQAHLRESVAQSPKSCYDGTSMYRNGCRYKYRMGICHVRCPW